MRRSILWAAVVCVAALGPANRANGAAIGLIDTFTAGVNN